MKAAGPKVQPFHLYLLNGQEQSRLAGTLAALGLESRPLTNPAELVRPALILLSPGQLAPEGLADISIELPADAPPSSLRELIRVAMQNVALKQQVSQLEVQAQRQHRQFKELNRIGIALSAERDIAKLQAFILTTMRQLTSADGASLWLKTEVHGEPKRSTRTPIRRSLCLSTKRASSAMRSRPAPASSTKTHTALRLENQSAVEASTASSATEPSRCSRCLCATTAMRWWARSS
jgi:hypothetical protein